MATAEKIEIYNSDPTGTAWTVRVGDRFNDHLNFGEMMDVLIKLTVGGRIGDPTEGPYGGLKTQGEHDAWRKRVSKTDGEFEAQEGQA